MKNWIIDCGYINVLIDGWMDGWMDEWMDRPLHVSACCMCMYYVAIMYMYVHMC